MKNFLVILISVFFITGSAFSQIGGYALNFDGNDYVNCGSSSNLNPSTALSIEMWVNLTDTVRNQKLLSKFGWGSTSSGFILGAVDGKLYPEIFTNNGSGWVGYSTTCGAIRKNVWTHLAMTWASGGYMYCYVNGAKVDSVATNNSLNTNYTSLCIGQWDGGYYSSGYIDEVRLWHVVRTETEIKTNMYKELNGNETGLKAYYKMSNGSGGTLSDNQTNVAANNGSISGATWKASGCFAGPKNCLDFDGTDDYISLPASFGSAFNSLQHFSFCGWVYQTNLNTDTWGTYFSVYNTNPPYGRVSFHQLQNSSSSGPDDILISISQNATTEYGEAYTTSNVLELNKWIHFAFIYDGTSTGNSNRLKFYVNGREVSLTFPYNIPSSFTSSFDRYYLARHNNPDYFKGGNFDEFSFWNVSLTQSQVREIMMKSLVGNETGLFAYYRFDQKNGTTLFDITANGHNGTLINMDESTAWVTSDAFNTWLGSESNTWSTAKNWSRGSVPVSTDNTGIYKWALGNELSLSGVPTTNHMFFSSTSSPTLNSNFTTNGEFLLNRDLDLNGNTITLGSNGYLNEGSYRVYGTSGAITTTRSLSNISAQNVGGLGATITTSADMGSTTITRG
ncbi:MAG: LamG domain-containing protein, partial [Ignavibacteria bacterium]